MVSTLEIILILALAGACLIFPIFDRRALRRLVKEQTGHEVKIPGNRLIYRIVQAFGLGFAAGGFVVPPVLGGSALEGSFLGGGIGVLVGILVRFVIRSRAKKAAAQSGPENPSPHAP